jgi:hypothetical protein
MDLAKSRADRFCGVLAICAVGGVLRVRARSGIARTRALFARFSDTSENPEIEWWSRVDLNWRPPLRLLIAKLSAELATNLQKIKTALLERALSPRVRLECFSPKVAARA